jgi:hypothetical protein
MTFALEILAEWTGLEPATPGVTGRYSNQLNYHSNERISCEGALTQLNNSIIELRLSVTYQRGILAV